MREIKLPPPRLPFNHKRRYSCPFPMSPNNDQIDSPVQVSQIPVEVESKMEHDSHGPQNNTNNTSTVSPCSHSSSSGVASNQDVTNSTSKTPEKRDKPDRSDRSDQSDMDIPTITENWLPKKLFDFLTLFNKNDFNQPKLRFLNSDHGIQVTLFYQNKDSNETKQNFCYNCLCSFNSKNGQNIGSTSVMSPGQIGGGNFQHHGQNHGIQGQGHTHNGQANMTHNQHIHHNSGQSAGPHSGHSGHSAHSITATPIHNRPVSRSQLNQNLCSSPSASQNLQNAANLLLQQNKSHMPTNLGNPFSQNGHAHGHGHSPSQTHHLSKNTNFINSQMLHNMSKMQQQQQLQQNAQVTALVNQAQSQARDQDQEKNSDKIGQPMPKSIAQNRSSAIQNILAKYEKNGNLKDLMSTPQKGKRLNNDNLLNPNASNDLKGVLPSPVMGLSGQKKQDQAHNKSQAMNGGDGGVNIQKLLSNFQQLDEAVASKKPKIEEREPEAVIKSEYDPAIDRSDTPVSVNSGKNNGSINIKDALEQLLNKKSGSSQVSPKAGTGAPNLDNFMANNIANILNSCKNEEAQAPAAVTAAATVPTTPVQPTIQPAQNNFLASLLNSSSSTSLPMLAQSLLNNPNTSNLISSLAGQDLSSAGSPFQASQNPFLGLSLNNHVQSMDNQAQENSNRQAQAQAQTPSTKTIIKNLANGHPFAEEAPKVASSVQNPTSVAQSPQVTTSIATSSASASLPSLNPLGGFNLAAIFNENLDYANLNVDLENNTLSQSNPNNASLSLNSLNSLNSLTTNLVGPGNAGHKPQKEGKKSSGQVRRVPVRFTQEQKRLLYQLFEINRYPKKPEREEIASKIGVPEYAVHNFFSNTRKAIYRAAACQQPGGQASLGTDMTKVESLGVNLEDSNDLTQDKGMNNGQKRLENGDQEQEEDNDDTGVDSSFFRQINNSEGKSNDRTISGSSKGSDKMNWFWFRVLFTKKIQEIRDFLIQ